MLTFLIQYDSLSDTDAHAKEVKTEKTGGNEELSILSLFVFPCS